MRSSPLFALLAVVTLLVAPTAAAADERAGFRARALEIARAYANHEWRGSEKNLFHGKDPGGVRVDTPDAGHSRGGWQPDQVNVGIPYQWGGFSSLEQFDRAIEEGRWAGHVPKGNGARATGLAAGVDCSGFLARCWELPTKQSTRSLPGLCYQLTSWDELLPGDALNLDDGHVMLFERFMNEGHTKLRVYEAGIPRVTASTHAVAALKERGYVPLRYKPLHDRWIEVELADPSFAVADDVSPGKWLPARDSSGGDSLYDLENLLEEAVIGDWARYVARDERFPVATTSTRVVAACDGDRVTIQDSRVIDGQKVETDAVFDLTSPRIDTLVDFAGWEERFRNLDLVTSAVEDGSYALGGREFPARRVTATVQCILLMRTIRYPVKLDVECIVSGDVPLQGILLARYVAEIQWGPELQGRATKEFQLQAFHRDAD